MLRHRAATVGSILALFAASLLLLRHIGSEFFPASDGQFSVIYKAPIGRTRVELTEEVGARVEKTIERTLGEKGKSSFTTMLSNNGLPGGRTSNLHVEHRPSRRQRAGEPRPEGRPRPQRRAGHREIRAALRDEMSGIGVFYFTGGIVKRILNFGAPAPIDVEVLGYNLDSAGAYAKVLAGKLRGLTDDRGVPLLADVQVSREENYPELDVVVDRRKAGTLGISQQQVAPSVLAGLIRTSGLAHPIF